MCVCVCVVAQVYTGIDIIAGDDTEKALYWAVIAVIIFTFVVCESFLFVKTQTDVPIIFVFAMLLSTLVLTSINIGLLDHDRT